MPGHFEERDPRVLLSVPVGLCSFAPGCVFLTGDLLLLGYDTETSMRSGAVNGMACEIDGMVQAFASQYPDFNAILTGGDEPFFGSKLKNKIFADPNLLLKGLNLILKHNVPYIQ